MTFLGKLVDGLQRGRDAHPPQENAKFYAFAHDKEGEGLHVVSQTPDGAFWRTNHLSGAMHQTALAEEGPLYGPEQVTQCWLHNFHLLPMQETCPGLAATDHTGRPLSMAERLVVGYQSLRWRTLRACIDWLEEPTDTHSKTLQKMVAELQHNTHTVRPLPPLDVPLTHSSVMHMLLSVLATGIPKTPRDVQWEYMNHGVMADDTTRGYCPRCGEVALWITVAVTEIHSFAPKDGYHGMSVRTGDPFSGRYVYISEQGWASPSEQKADAPWMPSYAEMLVGYSWPLRQAFNFRDGPTPAVAWKDRTPENASYTRNYSILPDGWQATDEPPLCYYCRWLEEHGV